MILKNELTFEAQKIWMCVIPKLINPMTSNFVSRAEMSLKSIYKFIIECCYWKFKSYCIF